MAPRISITADDAGGDRAIDKAIAHLGRERIIDSAAVFVTFPELAEETAMLLKPLPISLGLHLDFSSGWPISEPSQVASFAREGKFHTPTTLARQLGGDYIEALIRFRRWIADSARIEEVAVEASAQVQRFESLYKRSPAFVSVHHDLDLVPTISQAVLDAVPGLPPRQARIGTGVIKYYESIFATSSNPHAWQAKFESVLAQASVGVLGDTVLLVVHPSVDAVASTFTVYNQGRIIEYHGLLALADAARSRLTPIPEGAEVIA